MKSEIFQFFTLAFAPFKKDFDKLKILLDNLEHQFDVIALTETWHWKKILILHQASSQDIKNVKD